jgi:hypothetical protein
MSADVVTDVVTIVGDGVLSFFAQPTIARRKMPENTATPHKPAIRVCDVFIAIAHLSGVASCSKPPFRFSLACILMKILVES